MSLDPSMLDSLADVLVRAADAGVPVGPLSVDQPDMTVDEAYQVQERIAERRTSLGDPIVGWKIGLTSAAMQAALGVSQPDYAPVFAGDLAYGSATIKHSDLIQPKVEAEIAIILRDPLPEGLVGPLDVIRSAVGVAAAIEVIDSRIADWKITIVDTIADMASAGRFVVSEHVVPLGGFDLRAEGMVLERNGDVVATGAGAATMGGPLTSAAWLASALHSHGTRIEGGHFVMTGSLHAAVAANRGDHFRATFGSLGAVDVRFD